MSHRTLFCKTTLCRHLSETPAHITLPGVLAIRRAALLYCVITSVAIGCGDSNDSGPYVAEGKVVLPCSAHSVYRCWHDYSDTCRLNEVSPINFDDGCYEHRSRENCTEIEGCIEREWFAEDAYGRTVVVHGCLNDPPPESRTISNPSESLLSAAATSCGEVHQQRVEACRQLSVDDCLDEGEGCRVSVEDVIDWEQYCDTGEDRQYCEYPSGISLDAVFSWHICPYVECSGDEGPYEDCLEPTACVWTTDDESQCLPTCDSAEAQCAENEECQPLLRRTSDGVFEMVDVCVP